MVKNDRYMMTYYLIFAYLKKKRSKFKILKKKKIFVILDLVILE